MKQCLLLAAALPLLAFGAAPASANQTPGGGAPIPRCVVGDLSLSFDGENGNFDGMSHSGALLVLRNIGAAVCSVPRLPSLTFQDAAHRPLPVAFKSPIGVSRMVLLPLPLPPEAEATGRMRWVSGDVYDGHNCAAPAFVTLTIDGQTLQTAFGMQLCGPAGRPIPYELTWLKPDAVYRPVAP